MKGNAERWMCVTHEHRRDLPHTLVTIKIVTKLPLATRPFNSKQNTFSRIRAVLNAGETVFLKG